METRRVKISQDTLEEKVAKLFNWISRLRIIKIVYTSIKTNNQINGGEQGGQENDPLICGQLLQDKSDTIYHFGEKLILSTNSTSSTGYPSGRKYNLFFFFQEITEKCLLNLDIGKSFLNSIQKKKIQERLLHCTTVKLRILFIKRHHCNI